MTSQWDGVPLRELKDILVGMEMALWAVECVREGLCDLQVLVMESVGEPGAGRITKAWKLLDESIDEIDGEIDVVISHMASVDTNGSEEYVRIMGWAGLADPEARRLWVRQRT